MRKLLRRLSYLFAERQRQADLAEEIEFHREMKAREFQGAGRTSSESVVSARRAMGSVVLVHDEARDVWVWPWLQDLSLDARFAVRMLLKDARFAATAVLALALGIAVNNTIFTIFNTALLRDLPFDDPNSLVTVGTRDARGRESGLSYPDFNDWRAATRTLTGLAAYSPSPMSIGDDARAPERVQGTYVSSNTFSLVRAAPVLGRDFAAEDDRPGATPVVILSYGLWQRRYAGDAALLGRTIRVNGVPATVIGVMPPRFRFPFTDEIWQPLGSAPVIRAAKRDLRSLTAFGRLVDSRTIEQARAELEAIAAKTSTDYADTNKGVRPRLALMNDRIRGGDTVIFATLMGSVMFVLLIACANVANLLMARGAVRTREIAIRSALGATRWRIVRQLLIECGVLAALASVLGLALSVYGVKFLGVALDGRQPDAPASAAVTPYWVDLSMNETVFAFLGALCVLTTLLAGLAPALQVSKPSTNDVLKDGGRGAGAGVRARRWTSALMSAQVALTLILLTGAGLMCRSFVGMQRADRVIDTTGLSTARILLPAQRYPTPAARRTFLEQLDARLSSTPQLSAVSMATSIPFTFVPRNAVLAIERQPEARDDALPRIARSYADARYFETLKLPVTLGRSFTQTDGRSGEEAVIVNERFAAMYFPAGDAVGQRIRLGGADAPIAQTPWRTIVGVTPSIPQQIGTPEAGVPMVFVPLFGDATPLSVSVFVRSQADFPAVVSLLRDEVRALDPDLPVFYARTLEEVFADGRVPVKIIGGWFGALALIALMLATVGLYAITGHAVTLRRQEIGVRVALGAESRDVVWLFLKRVVLQLAIGVSIGLTGALAIIGLLRQTPFIGGANPGDPLTLVLVTILLVSVALIATLAPAWRATRVDPVVALRCD